MKKRNINWIMNHLKILKSMNETEIHRKTQHEIYKETGITPLTVLKHQKDIIECPICGFFTNKEKFCLYCMHQI